MEVKVHGNEVEKALRTLKNRLKREGLFREIKQRSYYEKPSERQKRKRREARKKKASARRR